MKAVLIMALVILIACPAVADELPAMEEMQKQIDALRVGAGNGLLIAGITIAAFGVLQYRDTEKDNYIILAGGGVALFFSGVAVITGPIGQ